LNIFANAVTAVFSHVNSSWFFRLCQHSFAGSDSFLAIFIGIGTEILVTVNVLRLLACIETVVFLDSSNFAIIA
jgi:hypothetical protein